MKSHIEQGTNQVHIKGPIREFFKLRKSLFVDEMKWDIPNDGEIELDQYDHECTTYTFITDEADKVIAGARILPTTWEKDGWSYMIRDAALGRIPQIPSQIMVAPPSKLNQYEITRFTVDPTLTTDQKNEALAYLAYSSYQTVADMGGEYALALMSPFFLRWFNALGISVNKLGPIVRGDGERYCVIGGQVEQRQYVAA